MRRRRAAQVRLAICRIYIIRDGAHVEVRPEAADGEARRAFVGVDALEDDVVLGLGEGDEEELEGRRLLGHPCGFAKRVQQQAMQPFLGWVLELDACFAEEGFGPCAWYALNAVAPVNYALQRSAAL